MFSDSYLVSVASEMSRFLTTANGWGATLLTQSSVQLLKELLVAGAQTHAQVLSKASFEDLKGQVRERLLEDLGFGTIQRRGALANNLPKSADEFASTSHLHLGLKAVIPSLEERYLNEWRTALTALPSQVNTPSPRRVAELITSFLLGRGLGSNYLARWIDYRRSHDPRQVDLSDFMDDLVDLIATRYRPIEALVILRQSVSPSVRAADGWLSTVQTRAWLENNGHLDSPRIPRTIHGAVLFSDFAWDLESATEQASAAIERIKSRAHVHSGRYPIFDDWLWVKGIPKPRRLVGARSTRHLLPAYSIPAPVLSPGSSDDRLEVATQFLLAAYQSEVGAAAGMLWAAMESLFAAPGDEQKLVTAQRAADVCLTALVRYELKNTIGMLRSNAGDPNFRASYPTDNDATVNAAEAYLIAGVLSAVASARMQVHLANVARLNSPGVMKDTRLSLVRTFRALYRHRNLVLHGGITDAPLRDGVLRAAFPLVTAVINRCARASAENGIAAQALAYISGIELDSYEQAPTSLRTVAGI
ncbi:hypothetical protein [Micromonospora taraxaci]